MCVYFHEQVLFVDSEIVDVFQLHEDVKYWKVEHLLKMSNL